MDRLIVLDEGRIVEEGSHDELLRLEDGHYARLWRHQSGGFLPHDVPQTETESALPDAPRREPHVEPIAEGGTDDAPVVTRA